LQSDLEAVKIEHDKDGYVNGSHTTTFMSEGDSIGRKNGGLITRSEFSVKVIEVEVSHAVSHCACYHVYPGLCLFSHLM
jgi:hypothetical protein